MPKARNLVAKLVLFLIVILARPPLMAQEVQVESLWYVQFKSPPLVSRLRNQAQIEPDLRQSHETLLATIKSENYLAMHEMKNRGIKVDASLLVLVHALRVKGTEAAVSALTNLSWVARILPVTLYVPHTSTSVPFVGAPRVWEKNNSGFTGKKIRIGIIDSGIDYYHANFGGTGSVTDYDFDDHSVVEEGTFPTTKVVNGTDFVGDDYDADDPFNNEAVPDDDPLDCREFSHGSHVAGIAAGMGVTVNESTFFGPYDSTLSAADFLIGPGMAPEASLVALKVFGCSGSTAAVIDALDWAADPNQDGDLSDRLDVINLSLGSALGQTGQGDLEQLGIQELVGLGTVVVSSAGNSGNSFYNIDSPSVVPEIIAVANSRDDGLEAGAIRIPPPSPIAGVFESIEGNLGITLAETGPISAKVVYAEPNQGCTNFINMAAMNGKIALIDRGVCFFSEKVRFAADAGAIAVIMVNNVEGKPFIMGGDGTDVSIPAVMISKADGARIKAALISELTAELDPAIKISYPELADQIEDSSSRGPSSPLNQLKPDMAAPGAGILSVRAGSGYLGRSQTGTSMASPHVAGAAALLREQYPDWSVSEIKAALMNTSRVMTRPDGSQYPLSQSGTGRLRVNDASDARLIAYSRTDPGAVTINFSLVELTNRTTRTTVVELRNISSQAQTVFLQVTNFVTEPGVLLSPKLNTVIVPPNRTTNLTFELVLDPALMSARGRTNAMGEFGGRIWFSSETNQIQLPFYGLYKLRADLRLPDPIVGVGKARSAVELRPAGINENQAAAVTVLEFVSNSPVQSGLDAASRPADLVTMGAACDYFSSSNMSKTIFYIGFATAGLNPAPNQFLNRYEVGIDYNNDGINDFVVFNISAGDFSATGNFDPNGGNGEFTAVLENLSTRTYSTNADLKLLTFDSPFNRSTFVFAIPMSLIKVTSPNTRFKYSIEAYSSLKQIDTAGPFFFTPSASRITTTPGQTGSSFSTAAGETLPLQLTPGLKQTETSLTVLMFYHANSRTRATQTVRLDLTTPDIDLDTMDDLWELHYFHDLKVADQSSDFDGDGISDRQAFLAGTSPIQPQTSTLPRLEIHKNLAGTILQLEWDSIPNRFYELLSTSNLAVRGESVALNIVATPPKNTLTNLLARGNRFFYLQVRTNLTLP